MGNAAVSGQQHEVLIGCFCLGMPKIDSVKQMLEWIDKNPSMQAVDASLSKVKIHPYFDKNKNEKINPKVIQDAQSCANVINSELKIKPVKVWWTGPTNDKSDYGAADIVVFGNGNEYPISIKFGSGQLKNLTIGTFLGSILNEIEDVGDTIENKINNSPVWKRVIPLWFDIIKTSFKEKETIEKFDEETKGIQDFKSYNKAKFKDINFWKKTSYYKKPTDLSSIAIFSKRIYSDFLESKSKKEWEKVKNELIVKEIFKPIIDKFYNAENIMEDGVEDILKSNIYNQLKRQLSIGNLGIWYCAEGGKKFWRIPSEEEIDNAFSENRFQISYDIEVEKSDFQFLLQIIDTKTKKKYVVITITIRWSKGQMVGLFDVKSFGKFGKDFKYFMDDIVTGKITNENLLFNDNIFIEGIKGLEHWSKNEY